MAYIKAVKKLKEGVVGRLSGDYGVSLRGEDSRLPVCRGSLSGIGSRAVLVGMTGIRGGEIFVRGWVDRLPESGVENVTNNRG